MSAGGGRCMQVAAGLVLACFFGFSLGGDANAQDSSTVDARQHFQNPIAKGADPWVIRDPHQARYLWCKSDNDRGILIFESDDLTTMGERHLVWKAPDEGPYSKEVWAPELHVVGDRYYVYFAASDGDNANHLTYVLESKTSDPLGEYNLHGPMATGDGEDGQSPNIWSIDMTLLNHNDQLFAIWSGWDKPGSDNQYLYIAPMSSPTELSGPRVLICDNDDYLWERVEPDASQRGLNEGPEVFKAKGKTSLLYSCGASWLPTYKIGRLELVKDNPLAPGAWKKLPEPAFQSTETVYGVGHSCFAKSLDDKQWWHIFHAKVGPEHGWNRALHLQPMNVSDDGTPLLGTPLDRATAIERPSGKSLSER
ncbi:glycoside hydrolase family 43 protein [Rhodopirellula bahusiensis]|nr:glycoside hydrolase family 43 protein [Rhodopirellula bahusiensis]